MQLASRPSIFHLFLVKPSKYDDEGFVIRHWRGVLPSNTLACLHGLTEEVRRRRLLGDVDLRVHLVDEAVAKIPLDRIARLNRRSRERVVVGLVGVQTNQFSRATDIALALRREEVAVIVGGFHVSGMLAMFPTVSPEIQRLVDAGVSVVAGEVEHRWGDVLRDAYQGSLKPIYRFLHELPDLTRAARPIVSRKYLRRFIFSSFAPIDCSRGCPFNCSFCTVINVQGRKSRPRSPECVVETLRHGYREAGVNAWFFTDDNFARNPLWEEIFDRLIRLREQEGTPIQFMIQVDVLAHRIPGFVEKAARAGCRHVFIGMESLNPRNLKDAGKAHNQVQEYKTLIDAWHKAGVRTHVAYIMGFPHDTEESVRADVERLVREIQPQQASFFMMMPLPGSRDHQRMVEASSSMDSDYNRYDSCHECMPHPHMKNGAWTRAYHEAWRTFYSFENMKAILSRAHPNTYWDILRSFYWHKNSIFNEGAHPMLSGFFRFKDRMSRRAGFPRESWWAHLRRRIPEICKYLRDALRLTLELEELWLQTRKRSETERHILEELARMRGELHRSLRISELQTAYARAKARVPCIEVPSRLSLLMDKISLLRVSRLRETRRDLAIFWMGVQRGLRQRRLEALVRLDRLALNALQEIRLVVGFLIALATAPTYGGGQRPPLLE